MSDGKEKVDMTKDDLSFIGAIMTANVKFSQDLSNRVEENLQQEAIKWRNAFLALFEDMEIAQKRARNMDVEQVLSRHSTDAYYATQPMYFEPEFRRGF